MKYLLTLTNLLLTLMLVRFSISKIAGDEVSRKGFDEMSSNLSAFVPMSSDFFRLFVGFTEAALGVLFVIGIYQFLKNRTAKWLNLNTANLLCLITMLGALASEYGLRDQPKMMLVYIAFVTIVFNLFSLIMLNRMKRLS